MNSPSSSGQRRGNMEAESNPSAQTPPGGSSPSLPSVATAVAVAAANDSSHTEGDAAEDRDGDNACQRERDIAPQQGPISGDGSGPGQSARENSLEKPSSATTNIDNDDGCSAEAKSVCGVASGRMYDVSEDESDTLKSMGKRKDQALLLDSDSDGSNGEGYMHNSRNDGDDVHVEAKQSAESDKEKDEERSVDETEHESLFEDDGLFMDEQAERKNGLKRNYLPPAPEMYEVDDEIGGNAVSQKSRDQISTQSDSDGKLGSHLIQQGDHPSNDGTLEEGKLKDAGLGHEVHKSMEPSGLGYSGKASEKPEHATFVLIDDDGILEKVPPMAPRPPTDEPFRKDGVIDGVSLVSKEMGPETVPAPGPRNDGFALDETADRVRLESEGPRPEVVAAPGPNIEPSRMVALSSPRGMIRIDMQFPTQGQNLPEGSAGGGGQEDSAQQMPRALPGAVAVPGPMLDEPTNSNHRHREDGSDYATATPFAANVVVDEETQGLARQRGRQANLHRPVLDPNEVVYEGVKVAKSEQGSFPWNHLSRYKWMCRLGLLVMFLAMAIGVPIAINNWRERTAIEGAPASAPLGDSSASPTRKPSMEPTLSPSVDLTPIEGPTSGISVIKGILLKAAEHASIDTTAEAIKNEGSPQHRASEWLINEGELFWGMTEMSHLAQRFALATLYFATGGNESWRHHYNFLTNVSECDWRDGYGWGYYFGVFCGEDNQTVEGLYFDRNGLTGTIPDELGMLVGLKKLGLGQNDLNGTLPSALANLSKLEVLNLEWNSLSGTLPFSLHSTNLQNLQKVWLGGNDLTGTLPQGLFMSTNMTSLDLNWNQFSGMLPTEIGKLSSLQALRLSDNDFSGQLPSNIWTLTELQWLDLSFNKFRGQLPSSIRVLTELQWLDLSYNAFSGMLPSSIGALTKLESLFLFRNRCNGPLPSSIGALTNLRYLSLHQNRFTGTLPDSLGNLTALQYLILSRNKFPGTIPDIFENMIDLEYLFLDVNKFTGTIPPSIASAKNLTNLSLANTSVAGDMAHFCNNRSKDNLEWIADCYGDSPEVVCDCCYVCCSDYERSSNLTVSDLLLTFYFGEGNLLGCFNMSDT